jgi:hypothetical protein
MQCGVCTLSMTDSSCHGARTTLFWFVVATVRQSVHYTTWAITVLAVCGSAVVTKTLRGGLRRRGWVWMWLAQGAWMLQQVYRQ